MATRRTKKAAPEKEAAAEAAPKAAAQPAIKPADLSRFLGLGDKVKVEDLNTYLQAAMVAADEYIGANGSEAGHLYKQGVLHLAAKFYAAGTTHLENKTDIPMVCRHFFELARRELSGSAK